MVVLSDLFSQLSKELVKVVNQSFGHFGIVNNRQRHPQAFDTIEDWIKPSLFLKLAKKSD